MNIEGINWDKVPETLSLEQLYKLIHVSKRVAKALVENTTRWIKIIRTKRISLLVYACILILQRKNTLLQTLRTLEV